MKTSESAIVSIATALFGALAMGMVSADEIRIVNANIVTMDADNPVAGSMVISGNRIVSIGGDGSRRGNGQGKMTVINAHGAVVIPGIIDQHLHWNRSAITWGYAIHDAEGAYSKEDLLAAIAARAADPDVPPGAWLSLIGRHNSLQFGGGYPTIDEIDAVSGDHPVVLLQRWLPIPSGDGFGQFNVALSAGPGQLNSLARDFFNGLVAAAPAVPVIPADGSLTEGNTGSNEAIYAWTRANNTMEEQIRSTLDLQRWSHSVGLVGIGDSGGGGFRQSQDFRALAQADIDGDLKMRIRFQVRPLDAPGTSGQSAIERLSNVMSAAPLAETQNCVGPAEISGSREGFQISRIGSPFYRVMGLGEFFAAPTTDSIRDATVYILRRHDWSSHQHAEAEQITAVIAGIEQALAVDDPCAVGASYADRHNSLDHLNDASDDDLARMAAVGVGAGIQAVRFLFPEWEFSGPPYRSAFDAQNEHGLHVGCGADGMFAGHGNPWTTLQFMVTGEAFDGTQLLANDTFAAAFPGSRVSDQRADLIEGLQCYTKGSAWFTREEDDRGQLKAGYLADVVILNQNPFNVDEHQIRDTKASLTIVDGEIVYSDGSLTSWGHGGRGYGDHDDASEHRDDRNDYRDDGNDHRAYR
jgi:predicted amidohydrolase YtcJ